MLHGIDALRIGEENIAERVAQGGELSMTRSSSTQYKGVTRFLRLVSKSAPINNLSGEKRSSKKLFGGSRSCLGAKPPDFARYAPMTVFFSSHFSVYDVPALNNYGH
jgi:hypothetical protein